jgi:glycosyltransferase involved in cell wall biosynthesis
MNNPLVSIIVPCYNQAQYLSEALQSVLDQTYTNWECIIVNDGSPDNTEAVAQEWLEKDTRFKYIFKKNGGLSSARNEGITIAEGEFILPLDADDRIGPNYLSLAVDEFKKDSELKVVYCKAEKFGDVTGLWKLSKFSLYDLCRFNMIFCSAIFKKQDWILVEGYDINMKCGLEDWEFWIAILKNGGNVKCIDAICFYYRVKENSMAMSMNPAERDMAELYVTSKHFKFYQICYEVLNDNRKNIHYNLKSEKFICNLFTKKFFGFKFFKNINNKLLR